MVRSPLTLVPLAALVALLGLPSHGEAAEPEKALAPDSLATSLEARGWQTGAFAPDRLQHASLAFSTGLAIGMVTREPAAAAAGTVALALAKELWDARRSRFDVGDLAAGAVGAALATLATLALAR